MNKATEQKLNAVLRDTLKIETISDNLAMSSVPSWDSLTHLQLLAKIDEVFGIDVDFEDSITITSIKAIKKVVGKYVKKSNKK